MSLLHKAALFYLTLGWSVFPLKPAEKIPYKRLLPVITDANGRALLDEQGQLKRGWEPFQHKRATVTDVNRWYHIEPAANLAVVTGTASGFFVLDCDTAEAAQNARKRGLPETVGCRTGNGLHYYFKMPDFPVGNRAGLLDKVDIRGTGGYVVTWPSIHPNGHMYQWFGDPRYCEIADAPPWLLDMLRPAVGTPRVTPQSSPQPTTRNRYAQAAFAGECARLRGVGCGERNNALNKAAYNLGQIVGDGLLTASEVEGALTDIALSIGLSEKETVATIASGLTDGIANPRSMRAHHG